MATYKVKVKWGKELYPDVELQTSEPPMVFKAQIFALTGVQPDRQKIMVKGSTVKDDSWAGAKLKNGSLVLMMGSKDEDVPQEPKERPVFVEDMSDAEKNYMLELPVGIKNLGNTCYLNAVIQSLKSVPEICEAIKDYELKSDGASMGFPVLAMAIQDVFRIMDAGRTAIPVVFVDLFRTTFPRFAEQGEGGKFMQQDASECWTELVRLFQEILKPKSSDNTKDDFRKSLIDQFFSGEVLCEWSCEESETEKKETSDKFLQLSCHISQEIRYVHSGLVARMKEQVTKRSEVLERDAAFTKKSTITRLPAYLTIEMVRFFYKEKERVNAKILKDVKFPMVLDVFELCSKQLQDKLLPMRGKHKIMEEELAEEEKMIKRGKAPADDSSKIQKTSYPTSFEDDYGSNNSGYYQLQAIVTHQGRTSSSGHYVSWIRYKEKGWLKCDDDDVTSVTEEDILKLSGGGDWHTAYILLYGPRKVEISPDAESAASDVPETSEKKPTEITEKMEED